MEQCAATILRHIPRYKIHEAASSILSHSVIAQNMIISLIYSSGFQHMKCGSLVGCSVISRVCNLHTHTQQQDLKDEILIVSNGF